MFDSGLRTSDFDYPIPEDLIAHHPAAQREGSRLMLLDRKTKQIEHHIFSDVVNYLKPSDLLVINDTKVIPAKLLGVKKEGTAKIDVLLLKDISYMIGEYYPKRGKKGFSIWETLIKPGKRLKVGQKVVFGEGEMEGEVLEKKPEGIYVVGFSYKKDFVEILEKLGEMPLPPYIKYKKPAYAKAPAGKQDTRNKQDTIFQRYQTVYAAKEGASAAPTAGLHFSDSLLKKIKAKGVEIKSITLHTGLATFRPVFADYLEEHHMHSEYLEVSEKVSRDILKAKKEGRRVVAVGTTVVRALESSEAKPFRGETELFMYPGYKFKVVDALITNFHFPKSTLIMLVSAFAKAPADKSAFAGRDFIFKAYREAIKQKYRFYSFGDAMLIA